MKAKQKIGIIIEAASASKLLDKMADLGVNTYNMIELASKKGTQEGLTSQGPNHLYFFTLQDTSKYKEIKSLIQPWVKEVGGVFTTSQINTKTVSFN